MKKTFLTLLVLVFLQFTSDSLAQSTITGAYGGSEFYTSMSGTIRNDKAIFFRSDGTYCNELKRNDWQSKVSGHYSVSGKTITLVSAKDGAKSHATIKDNGNLSYGGIELIPFDVMNALPAQTLQYKMVISGGGRAGGAFGAGQKQDLLSFDGKGNFSHSAFHGTLVGSGAVAGGKVNSSAGDGTYTIEDSELTLHYKNGKTSRMSFFLSPGKTVVALINGRMYYEPKNKKK